MKLQLASSFLLSCGLSALAYAQGSGEAIFVGTSVSGSLDPYYLLDPTTGAVLATGGNTSSNNVSGVTYTRGGRELVLSSSLGNQVTKADALATTPVPSVLTPFPAATYGVAEDALRGRLWTLVQVSSGTELCVIDYNPASPAYGVVVGSAGGISTSVGLTEQWALSPDGNCAAIPGLVFSGLVALVDTNPASANYLQHTVTTPLTNIPGTTFAFDIAFDSSGRYVVVCASNPTDTLFPIWDRQTNAWVDTLPGTGTIDHIEVPHAVGKKVRCLPTLAGELRFVASGLGAGSSGANGWTGRVNYNLSTSAVSFTRFLPASGVLTLCDGLSVSPDGSQLAVTARTPSRLELFDTTSGAPVRTINLPNSTQANMYHTAWRNAVESGVGFCFGDGSTLSCLANPAGGPGCGDGAPGHGCANSINPSGALLEAYGTPSVSLDSLQLRGSGMPNSSALYFQGTTEVGGGFGAYFGDGLRCAGGSVIRLGTKVNALGASQYPSGANQPVSVRGAVPPGSVRTYQVWYRNAAGGFCTSSTFNLSNGVSVTWYP
jgi:hypothetical protein